MEQTSQCVRCEQVKPTSDFARRSAHSAAPRPTCKACNTLAQSAGRLAKAGGTTYVAPPEPQSKRCIRCLDIKSIGEFRRKSGYPGSYCKNCEASLMREWRAKNPGSHLKRTYGISPTEYQALLLGQDGGCAICGKTSADQRDWALSVDHNHACCPGGKSCGRCVRGLLCVNCNGALSYIEDSTWWAKATAYLNPTGPG